MNQPMNLHGFVRRAFRADAIQPRLAAFQFSGSIPKHWLGGNATHTHLMNALNLFLPSFERMIMRTVRQQVIPRLGDARLIAQAQGFVAQEGTHSKAHGQFITNLRQQGYRVDGFLACAEWCFENLLEKRVGYKWALATIAGFEHYTNLLVTLAFKTDFLDDCDPYMLELILWHTAEEVEHGGVAFELLNAVDDSYGLRMLGSFSGAAVTIGFMLAGAAMLLQQDGKLDDRTTWRELSQFFFRRYGIAGEFVALFRDYARRNFHPSQLDHSHYARLVLDSASVT